MNATASAPTGPKSFAIWYEDLAPEARARFAARAKTTTNYIESHLLAPYKIPRAEAMENLAVASEEFTVAELAAWFYEASLARRKRLAGEGNRGAS